MQSKNRYQRPTVGSEIAGLFPKGTRDLSEKADWTGEPNWDWPPILPQDIFACAAHLIEASGAYQYIAAPLKGEGDSPPSEFDYEGPTFSPSIEDLDLWVNTGRAYALNAEDNHGILDKLWRTLTSYKNELLVKTPVSGPPDWWLPAYGLLVTSDEASEFMGYDNDMTTSLWAHDFNVLQTQSYTDRNIIPHNDPTNGDELHVSRHVALDSIAPLANRHVVRVAPKGRATELGCTFRTISHNLSLLPAHGRGNVYWHQTFSGIDSSEVDNEMNVLLIPYPYCISTDCFEGTVSDTNVEGEEKWGRFRVDQKWLKEPNLTSEENYEKLASFVVELIKKSKKQGAEASAVMFPEMALDWPSYDAIARSIRDNCPEVTMLIAGVSADCNDRAGNQVVVSTIRDLGEGTRIIETHSRRKHHRWKLNGDQIKTYDLTDALDPEVTYWEHLEVEERVLHLDVLMNGALSTAVICEDLARVDPGLQLLRSIGPSLVFALLMDGAQIKDRWPGIYATGLSDDPGSSVLSLTSFGLVRKGYETLAKDPKNEPSRSVGLWKGATQHFNTLDLETGSHAIIVKLEAHQLRIPTMDGRINDISHNWEMSESEQVSLSEADLHAGGFDWIAKGAS